MPSGRSSSFRVAIVGASSLRGKELVQVLEDRHFPASDIVLLDASVPAGTLTEAAGEPTFIRALDEESFEGARVAFLRRLAAGCRAELERGGAFRCNRHRSDGRAGRTGASVRWKALDSVAGLRVTSAGRSLRSRRDWIRSHRLRLSRYAGNHRLHPRGGPAAIGDAANFSAAVSTGFRTRPGRRRRTREPDG